MDRKPDFIVIGAQKSASTFLQTCLADHPEIYMPKGELPMFESPDYEAGAVELSKRYFVDRRESKLGFKRPNYLTIPEVPSRIWHDNPNVKLVAVLRDPVRRYVSAYYHYVRADFAPLAGINEFTECLLDKPEQVFKEYPRCRELLQFGMYGAGIRGYLSYFPRQSLQIVMQEELGIEGEGAIQSVYRFLGVDDSYVPKVMSERPQRVPYHPTLLRFGQWESRLLTHQSDDGMRNYRRRAGIGRTIAAGSVRLMDRMVSPWLDNDPPVLSESIGGRLRGHYRLDILAAQDLIGVDLSHWLME